jgi:hypothetical protein
MTGITERPVLGDAAGAAYLIAPEADIRSGAANESHADTGFEAIMI